METIRRNMVGLFQGAVVRRVLDVSVLEGAGVEGNPIRVVRYLVDADTGDLLARIDELAGEQPNAAEVALSAT